MSRLIERMLSCLAISAVIGCVAALTPIKQQVVVTTSTDARYIVDFNCSIAGWYEREEQLNALVVNRTASVEAIRDAFEATGLICSVKEL